MKKIVFTLTTVLISCSAWATTWRAVCYAEIHSNPVRVVSSYVQASSSVYSAMIPYNDYGQISYYLGLASSQATDTMAIRSILTEDLANSCKAFVQSQANLYRVKAGGYWKYFSEVETGLSYIQLSNGNSDLGISTGTGIVSPYIRPPSSPRFFHWF